MLNLLVRAGAIGNQGMSAAHWAFWVAVAALVAACGKFLSDYHIKASTKSKMRNVLFR
jgi:hypothetical protein